MSNELMSPAQSKATTPYMGKREYLIIGSFIALAVGLRILFWLYTDRIWEDALITLNPARNFWEGNGLTHHTTEPRVYSFTSTLSVIILIIGEGFGHPIAFDRLVSLASAALAIFFAARTLQSFSVPLVGQAVCLSYLSTDHLQIFFGMSGMETQAVTAIALGVIWAVALDRRIALGILAGLAALSRPEFLLLDAVFGLYAVFRWKLAALGPIVIALAIFLPWIAFTWLYYGSPIPNTISVKSSAAGNPNREMIVHYALNLWKQFAPFKEFWFVSSFPGPSFFPGLSVAITVICGIIGVVYSMFVRRVLFMLIFLILIGFFTYMVRYNVNPYFMWYTPPFYALFFLLVAVGVGALGKNSGAISYAAAAFIMFAYAVHLPFTLILDKAVQDKVEWGVRDKVGIELAKEMTPSDSVFLEPLGYIGLHIRDRQIFDNPGLGSKIAAAAIRKSDLGAIRTIKPTFVVMRPGEVKRVNSEFKGLLDDYKPVWRITGTTGDHVSFGGLTYGVGDDAFIIFRRNVPTPPIATDG